MPAYQVTGPDGRKYRVDAPEGATSQDAIAYIYDTQYGGKAPAAPTEPKPEDQSVFRQVADVPLQAGTGLATGIRMITDAFGADNPVSQGIRGVEGYLQDLLSAQSKQDQREISRIMQDAQDKGVVDQVVAGLKAFATAPVDMLSQAAGTAVPTIVGGLAGAALKAPALIGAVGTGAAMGTGMIKSDIYDQVKSTLTEMGATPEEAERRAVKAQEYGGENLDQILLGTVIGGVTGRFGLEASAAKSLANDIAKKSAVRAAVGEAVPEAVQAAQEQVAQNVALQREGIDVPTFRGAVGAGTLEGIAGAVLGGGFEKLRGRGEAEGAPTVAPGEAEVEPELTPEELAPKGAPARPSPIRAKTLEELQAAIPVAPKAEEKVKAEAPAREPMTFERTKEPTPEAVQEASDFLDKFPEGGKEFNLFKARAIAKKLGYEGITNKTTRADIEPLIRGAFPRETITPSEDVVVGQNAAGEQLYERADGSRYRMRFDRGDRPSGYPDFGGDLAPIEAAAPEVKVPEAAQVDVLAGKEVRPPTDDVYEVADANFNYPRMIGNQTVPIDQLKGGVAEQAGERTRVDELANQIASDQGYFSRVIVDQNNNVIEGQHRLEALRKLGAKEVPVYKIEDMGETFPVVKMETAVLKAQPMREEQASQIVKRALDAVAETGSVQEAAKLNIPGFQKGYLAALEVAESAAPRAEVPSEQARAGISEADVGAGARGVELPVSREGAERPAVAEPTDTGLERVGAVAEQPVSREAAPERPLKKAKRVDQGIVGEESPEALASLQQTAADETVPVTPADNIVAPDWTEGSKGFGYRQYKIFDSKTNKTSTVQEIRAPVNPFLGEEPAVIRRGLDYNGKPFGEIEATGRLKDVLSGKSFEQFQEYFATKEAAPTRIFESIDTLNRDLPDLSDQAREQAPSLRRELGRAKKEYDAGKITGDKFAETAGNLLLATQKERIVRPRVRGAEYIRERLLNAKRNGTLSSQGADLAEWFVRQNPLLVDDLGISIRQQPKDMKGTAGFYNPVNRITTIFNNKGDTQTAVHEILHHTEQLMPTNIRAGIMKAYTKQLLKAAKNAKTDAEKQFFKAIENYQYFSEIGRETDSSSARRNAKNEYEKALDLIRKDEVPKSFYQYSNPSEFWAVNGSRIVEGRYGIPPGIIGQLKRWLREFVEKAKSVFGLNSDAPIIRALDSLAKSDGKYQTRSMLAEAPTYAQVTPTQKPGQPKKSIEELRRAASEKMIQPGIIRRVINTLNSPTMSYENIVKTIQDQNRNNKKTQEDLRQAGKLEYIGEGKTNIDDQMRTSANRASYIVATEVEPAIKRLVNSMTVYANDAKISLKDALEKIDAIRIALHEPERRETKYLRNVPLDNTKKESFLPGEPPMTAADARTELEKRRSLTKDKAQAEALQDMIRYLAANYADPQGYSPVKAQLEKAGKPTPEGMTTDYYDNIYNVIGPEYTQEELEATRNAYENDPNKDKIDQVMQDWNALHELNKDLNRRSNYWTDKVDRVIESYGWKNYAPFKGSPKGDKIFDTDTEYLTGELSSAPEGFNGRRTNFDSPLLQTVSEAYFAASNAGRGTDVTQTIKNLIDMGVIESKRPKKFTFEDRNSPDFDFDQIRGRDKVLHFNEDGSVEVYALKDPEQLEAIKTPYREMNWAIKMGNSITSTLGQFHTRFNVAFPPMDFIRNSLTNAALMAARGEPKLALQYAGAVATDIVRSGLFARSGKVSKLIADNNTAELNRLYKKDEFYRDTIDMIKYGGRTMYRASFDIGKTMDELAAKVGPKKILEDESSLLKWVDAYNDAFEITSRVGAYRVRKAQSIADAKKRGLNVNDPKVMDDIKREAAAFSLSLMDFRKIGKIGKELGAWFMFIRPAATGAVDAIDALRPGFDALRRYANQPSKAFERLDPRVQQLFETRTLAEEVKRIENNKRPDKKKIAALKQEIAKREQAFKDFEARSLTRANVSLATAAFYIAAGAALYGMAAAASGEDDEGRNRVATDDMSRWTRYLRLPIIGKDGFFQIPWGFGVSGLMSLGAQNAALARGATSFKDYAGNVTEIAIDSFLPIPASRINPFENFGAWVLDSATPSAARPVVEFLINVDAMGSPIYNSRTGKYADAYSGSSRASELHRAISQQIFDTTGGKIDWSPDSISFIFNNYADAPNHVAENAWNLALTASGDKEFDAKKDTFILRSFIGRNSNYDARQFAEAESKLKDKMRTYNTLMDYGDSRMLNNFLKDNPNIDILIDTYNAGVNGELRKLRQERNEINRDKTLTVKQRERYLEGIRIDENYIKKGLVEDMKAYNGR